MYAVVSDVTFGTPAYLPVRRFPEDIDRVRASASLPTVSRIVEIDGQRYLDGGTTDSIPFETAMGLPGAREIEGHVPRRARPRGAHAGPRLRARRRQRGHCAEVPPLRRATRTTSRRLRTRGERYNAQRELLWELEAEGRCLVIAPEEPVTIGSARSARASRSSGSTSPAAARPRRAWRRSTRFSAQNRGHP